MVRVEGDGTLECLWSELLQAEPFQMKRATCDDKHVPKIRMRHLIIERISLLHINAHGAQAGCNVFHH